MATSKILIDGVGIDLTSDTVAADKLLSGYTAHNNNGVVVTGNIQSQAAKTVTPSTSSQTAVAAGKYTTGAVTVTGDANLVSGNIKNGVSIFGVSGTYAGSTPFGVTSYNTGTYLYTGLTVSQSGSALTIGA